MISKIDAREKSKVIQFNCKKIEILIIILATKKNPTGICLNIK